MSVPSTPMPEEPAASPEEDAVEGDDEDFQDFEDDDAYDDEVGADVTTEQENVRHNKERYGAPTWIPGKDDPDPRRQSDNEER